jgi:molybdenum cofactor guanylyltransferase
VSEDRRAHSAHEPEEAAAGFVLAGGSSSRMGADKVLLELAGSPLIAHALRLLREANLDAAIAGSRSADLVRFATVIPDTQAERGPLAGVCAALASTAAPLAVLVSVDAPLLPAALLNYMLHHARVTGIAVTLASVNGFTQTFPAVLHCRALPVLQESLRTTQGGCFAAFRSAAQSFAGQPSVLPVERLAQSGHVVHPAALPAHLWFANINTQEDFSRVASILAGLSHPAPTA